MCRATTNEASAAPETDGFSSHCSRPYRHDNFSTVNCVRLGVMGCNKLLHRIIYGPECSEADELVFLSLLPPSKVFGATTLSLTMSFTLSLPCLLLLKIWVWGTLLKTAQALGSSQDIAMYWGTSLLSSDFDVLALTLHSQGKTRKEPATEAWRKRILWNTVPVSDFERRNVMPETDFSVGTDIDIVMMAFLIQITTGTGGQPVYNLANSQNNCTLFEGTSLLNCSSVGDDIRQCQSKYGKKVLLSIGGATYTEGGFESAEAAESAARLVWDTFGPAADAQLTNTTDAAESHSVSGGAHHLTSRPYRTNSGLPMGSGAHISPRQARTLRPFGNAVVDGFDFDFETPMTNVVPFARALRSLMDQDSSKQYFLTAAPQCPYPDLADESLLRSDVHLDAVFVQFYNNYCGLGSFVPNATTQSTFNFHTWDSWAAGKESNGSTSVFLGVPASPTAAGSGYLDSTGLRPIVEYCRKFKSFGGIMMWDASQALGNPGFLSAAKDMLR